MKSSKQVLGKAFVAVAAAIVVSACGGGGGGGGSTPSTTASPAADSVPPVASASVAGLIGWASHLPQSDVTEPLSTATFKPPVDDTAEPTPII